MSSNVDNPKLLVQLPKMHWEIGTPQEQLLDYVREMKRNMASIPAEYQLFGGSKAAERDAYVHAYETVEKHIIKYMPFWESSFSVELKREKNND